MQTSICSFSFHRLLAAGKQDIFGYIADSKRLGCTHLQPWNAHFAAASAGDAVVQLGRNPGTRGAPEWLEPPSDAGYLREIRDAAREAGLPFELIAVDRAYIFDADPAIAAENRARAYGWIDAAGTLGAGGVRIDAGGPEDPDADVLRAVAEGYADLIRRGRDLGVEIFIENHWGSSRVPENIVRYLETIDGLRYLFDTNNWAPGRQRDGWRLCAPFAAACHIKTFAFDAAGNETSTDLAEPIRLLAAAGYRGVWGVESVPRDGDELGAAARTLALIARCLGGG